MDPFLNQFWLISIFLFVFSIKENTGLNIYSTVHWSKNATTVAGSPTGISGADAVSLFLPLDVFVNNDSSIYVLDAGNNRIQLWLPNAISGTTIISSNSTTELHQFTAMRRISVDTDGNIFILDMVKNRVTRWASDGSVGSIVAGGNGIGNNSDQFNGAFGMYVETDPLIIWIADTGNHRIVKWLSPSNSTIVCGTFGSGAAEFNNPYNLFIDKNDQNTMYVVDAFNHRIQQWTAGATTGITAAGQTGVSGSGLNQLSSPSSIIVDTNRIMFILDTFNNRIIRWTVGLISGEIIAGGYSGGTSPNQLLYPLGFSADASGSLYVADTANNRIQKFTASCCTESHISTALSSNRWYIDSYLTTKRFEYTTVAMDNGQVLTCGRYVIESNEYATDSSCEIYSPTSRKWHTTANMQVERATQTLTVLQNGKSVLAIGCFIEIDSHTAEIYDIETDRWRFVPIMMEDKRYLHTATLLKNGQVLIAGGWITPLDLTCTSSVHLYDPSSDTFIKTGDLNAARSIHVATLLNDGLSVLVTGGTNIFYNGPLPAEIYTDGSWSYTIGSTIYDRFDHAAVLLLDGNVLIAGGHSQISSPASSVELYNSITRTFSLMQPMGCGRRGLTLTLLPSGQVLAAGGIGSTTDGCPLVTEQYNPATGQWTSTRLLNTIHINHVTTVVNNSVFLIGGFNETGTQVDQCERYDL